MSDYHRLAGASILVALAGVTIFKLFQEPVSQPLIGLVLAVIVSAFVLLGLKFKSIKFKDIELAFDQETGRRLDDVTVSNPYGEQEILLNGRTIQIAEPNLDALDADTHYVEKKYGFALAKPPNGLKCEFIAMRRYVEAFESDMGGMEMLLEMPIIRESRLFRVAHPDPLCIQFARESYAGDYVGEKALAAIAKRLNQKYDVELQGFAKQTIFPFAYKHFNELALMVCPRKIVEDSLVLDTMGRDVPLTPLNYVMRFGGVPPKLDLLEVKHASVSHDGRVWGFYGESRYHQLLVDGVRQSTVHFDFYKLFLMNDRYVYQISLNYIPTVKHPRATWDELARLLQSFRVVA